MTLASPLPYVLDVEVVDRFLREVGVARSGQLRAEALTGGRSNLTFALTDDHNAWVLRRPPVRGGTPSAHDMMREYRVLRGLQDTSVPVARTIAAQPDPRTLGAPFQIVEFVAGEVRPNPSRPRPPEFH